MNILILEDDSTRVKHFRSGLIGHSVFVTDSTKTCIDKLRNEKWDLLLLDHDLGGEIMVESGNNTGYEVACWLESNPEFKPTQIVVHSLNNAGARNIQRALPEAIYIPWIWLHLDKYF